MKKVLIINLILFMALSIFAENSDDKSVIVSGFRSAQDVLGEIRFHIVSMRYKFHLKKIPPPSVPVVVSVSIDKYGNSTNPAIISPDTLSVKSREIILDDLLGWKFVQIHTEGETKAQFPLDLENRLK